MRFYCGLRFNTQRGICTQDNYNSENRDPGQKTINIHFKLMDKQITLWNRILNLCVLFAALSDL